MSDPTYPFFEIDFPPIEGKKSGDAILIRIGRVDPRGKVLDSKVWLIDGGFTSTAEYILEFMKKYYGSTRIDYIIATHSDNDHIEGLAHIIDNSNVGMLYIHDPSKHVEETHALESISSPYSGKFVIRGGASLEGRFLIASLQTADNINNKASTKGITLYEPFCAPNSANAIHTGYDFLKAYILGPDEEYYKELLSKFRDYEEYKKYVEEAKSFSMRASASLEDPPANATSPENNSSVILLFDFQGDYFLFTGDAGVPALEKAFRRFPGGYAGAKQTLLFKVPHHGSKNNLGPSLLDKAFGSIARRRYAIILAADQDADHPHEVVVNELKKRGFEVHANKYHSDQGVRGQHLWFRSKYAPTRNSGNWELLSHYTKLNTYTLSRMRMS